MNAARKIAKFAKYAGAFAAAKNGSNTAVQTSAGSAVTDRQRRKSVPTL